jgi:hypothetical protein
MEVCAFVTLCSRTIPASRRERNGVVAWTVGIIRGPNKEVAQAYRATGISPHLVV